MQEKDIRKIISDELKKLIHDKMSFRSERRTDSPVDTYNAINSQNVKGSFFPITGGTVSGNVTVTGSASVNTDLSVTGKSGFNGTTPIAKPTVTGSRGGNAALASLLTALANYGLIVDSSS